MYMEMEKKGNNKEKRREMEQVGDKKIRKEKNQQKDPADPG